MFRMKFSKHGCDTPARNGFGASGTKWSFEGMEVRFAIRSSVMFEKVAIIKRLVASGANKAVGMPLGVQAKNIMSTMYAVLGKSNKFYRLYWLTSIAPEGTNIYVVWWLTSILYVINFYGFWQMWLLIKLYTCLDDSD